jgi:hypothetical protein
VYLVWAKGDGCNVMNGNCASDEFSCALGTKGNIKFTKTIKQFNLLLIKNCNLYVYI